MTISDIIRAEFTNLSDRAQERIRHTRPTLLNQWDLYEEGHGYDTITAESAEAALEEARGNVDRSNYSDAKGTIWIDVKVRNTVTGETDSDTVQLDQDEPDCARGKEHDWKSPFSVLGGCKENPGVWGNAGGVIIKEVCAHCGRYKITDTWAQRRDTGEQGLTSVAYGDADDASKGWAIKRKIRAAASLIGSDGKYEVSRADDDSLTVAVAYAEDDDSDLEALRALLGDDYEAEYTGNHNTDADGDDTCDIVITVAG